MTISAIHANQGPGPGPNFASLAATVGVVAVGAALFEVALIPGIMIGAAAIVAPRLASKRLPKLRRGFRSFFQRLAESRDAVCAAPIDKPALLSTAALQRFHISEAVAKTITFRIAVASLDFAWSYFIIGQLATAAGLSIVNLAAGPVFYFLHEAAWNYYSSPGRKGRGSSNEAMVILPPEEPDSTTPVLYWRGLKIDRALAKTIVYETLGAIAEVTVNFIVVGDIVTAAIIAAPLILFGPFIYFGHEKIWDYMAARARRALLPPDQPAQLAQGF